MKDARQLAASYLNVKPRTRMQLIKHLKSKGIDEDAALEAVDELEQYHFIDDVEYSKMYFRYGFDKGRGIERIRRELSQKGVADDVIDEAYEQLEDVPDQYEAAMDIAEAMIDDADVKAMSYEERRKLQAKVGRRLTSRGFSSDIVYDIINRIR